MPRVVDAVLFDPENINALINRALVCTALGQYEPAISDMNLVVGVDPSYVKAYLIRESAHAKLGMAAQYLANLNHAVSLGMNRAAAELNIGSIASSQ
jgi:tetratricopeptide (TPR) repeat protein|tara:strand:- start:196 stop:486 length:291 start_codon:yes stop_codon:yes gene_type:complete